MYHSALNILLLTHCSSAFAQAKSRRCCSLAVCGIRLPSRKPGRVAKEEREKTAMIDLILGSADVTAHAVGGLSTRKFAWNWSGYRRHSRSGKRRYP